MEAEREVCPTCYGVGSKAGMRCRHCNGWCHIPARAQPVVVVGTEAHSRWRLRQATLRFAYEQGRKLWTEVMVGVRTPWKGKYK